MSAETEAAIAPAVAGENGLARAGAFLFAATLVGNVCNYLFQFTMSRALPAGDFGALNAVLAVATILLTPASVVMMAVSRSVAERKARGEAETVGPFTVGVLRWALLFAAAAAAMMAVASPWIAGYLVLSDPWPVLLAGLIVGVGLIVPVNLGVFQGLQSFAAFGILLGLSGVLRLAAGIVLVSIGAGLLGALGASVVSSALILAGSLALLASRLRNSGAARTKAPPLPAGRLRSVVPVAAGMLLFSILTNLDMILVKHFFGPEEAGRYAGAAILGRALLYLPTAIAMALYPMVAEAETLQGDSRVILRRGLRLTAFLTAAALVPYVLFPDLLLRILLGPAFVSAAPLVRLFGLAMAPFTLVFVLLNFQLARRRAAFLVPFVLACLVEFGLITLFFHQRMEHVLMVVAGVGAVLLSWALVGTAAGDRPEFSERLGADEGV